MARDHLREHPEACKVEFPSHRGIKTSPKGGRPPISDCERGKHGTVTCVAAFLGEKNWSRTRIDAPLSVFLRTPRWTANRGEAD
jgi:hypothetical protein